MNKYGFVLLLRSPKLFNNIIAHRYNYKNNIDVANIMDYNTSFSIKNEKINKSTYKDIDFIEVKKTKNRHKKKIRSKIHIDKHVSEVKDDIELAEINTDSLIRSSKNTKIRKLHQEKSVVDSDKLDSQEVYSKDIYLNNLLTVHELSMKLHVSTTDIIKWLFLQGISVTINQLLDVSISSLVAKHYSFNVLKSPVAKSSIINKSLNKQEGRLRTPVIALLGHVDHGKTSLLKRIKRDNSRTKEAGNITQSLGSYEVFIDTTTCIKKMIFLDTPGHEAFISMRERGADITDIVILVVAADDGLKPQTIEAIHHIRSRNLPFIVAINKIDKPEANISRVKKQLLEFNITDTDDQGNHLIVEISSLNGYNIDVLVTSLISLSRIYQWKSDPSKSAEGSILEAYLNRQKGPVAQLLIRNGTLHVGDILVAGNFYGKVKAIQNTMKQNVSSVESTTLVDVLCFTEVPKVGLSFIVVENEKNAKMLASKYISINDTEYILNNRISLDDVKQKGSRIIIKQVNLIIKTRTKGSIDAIVHTLSKIPQEKVQINLLMAACGEVSLKDIDLALASNSIILIFGLNISTSISQYADSKDIFVSKFDVIYDLIDYVKQQMLKFIETDYAKKILGYGEVKNLFPVNKGVVAGCSVQSGKLKKDSYFQLKRKNENVYIGLIDSIKRIKDDVDEVYEGNECGILCKEYNLWEIEDLLECYELQALEKTL